MHDAFAFQDIIYLRGSKPVLPGRIPGFYDRMRQTVAEREVRLVRVQELAQNAVVTGDEFFAVI
jgi:hypothetical protein